MSFSVYHSGKETSMLLFFLKKVNFSLILCCDISNLGSTSNKRFVPLYLIINNNVLL